MISASVNKKDNNELIAAIRIGNELVTTDSMKLLEETLYKIEYEAYQTVPIKTGVLAASIRTNLSRNKLSGSVTARGGKRPYAAWVEYGTVKTPAQPFLVPAATKFMGEFFRGVSAIVRKRL